MAKRRWNVYGAVSATKFLGTFEAETAEEAEEMAMEANGHVSVCHHCADEVSDPEIHKCTVEEDAPAPATSETA